MKLRFRYAFLGLLLGLGAPLGSLAWRAATQYSGSLALTLLTEWQSSRYYYLYMTFGTVTAFCLYGLLLGRRDEDLVDLSITDGLTGLYNHRYLHERLDQEIERSARYHYPITCLMIDIDDFKTINDRFGHPFGDQVLAGTARLIAKTVRRTDIAGRYGGEEFLVIMPQTDTRVALPLAQRLLKVVEQKTFLSKRTTAHVTVSIGLAMFPDPGRGVKTKSALLSASDQALYKAKIAGKNQALVWTP